MIELDTIHKMWEQDSCINENELDRASIDTSKLHAKYLQLFNTARLTLKRRELELAELKQEKWRYFTGKMTKEEMDSRQWKYDPFNGTNKPMRSELDSYIDSDKDIQKIIIKIEYLKIVADAIEEILNNLKWRHSAIKNCIDWRKFTSGI